jgi:hypothetical protein
LTIFISEGLRNRISVVAESGFIPEERGFLPKDKSD